MKTKLLPLLALFLIFFSCKEDEEVTPVSKIQGSYESVIKIVDASGDEFNFVDRITLNLDGTASGEYYTSKVGSNDVLGYRGYFSGTYAILDQIVTISYEEYYFLQAEGVSYLPKNELTKSEDVDQNVEYIVKKDYSELNYNCPPNAYCVAQPYFKVN